MYTSHNYARKVNKSKFIQTFLNTIQNNSHTTSVRPATINKPHAKL